MYHEVHEELEKDARKTILALYSREQRSLKQKKIVVKENMPRRAEKAALMYVYIM